MNNTAQQNRKGGKKPLKFTDIMAAAGRSASGQFKCLGNGGASVKYFIGKR